MRSRPTVTRATGELEWSWKVGSKTWTYETTVRLHKGETSDGDAWLVRWDPDLVEPSLKAGRAADRDHLKAERGEILGAEDAPLVTLRPVLRVGRRQDRADRRPGARLRAAGWPSSSTSTPRRSSSRSRHPGPGPSCRRSSTAAATHRPTCSPGCPTSRVPAPIADKLPLAPDQGLRRRDPRAPSVRPPPSWSRRARAGSGPATTSVSPACRSGTTSSWPAPVASQVVAVDGRGDERRDPVHRRPGGGRARCAPRSTSDTAGRGPGGAGRRRPGQRARGHPALDR